MKKDQFKFDKFVKDICKREEAGKQRVKEHLEGQEELPPRKYNRLYRENWRNSTQFRGKK